jgi:hypothetical protein
MTSDIASKTPATERDHDSRLVKVLKAIDKVGSGGARRSDIEDLTGFYWDLPRMLEMITRWGLIKVVHSNYWNWYYLTDSGREYLNKQKEN